jgi:ubiquinone/menaquinone biosynthesis C-methylase UbiE
MHPGSVCGDIAWYCRKAVESGGPVLELGAGTGRITVPVAEAGVRVSALDLDSGMLARLRQKVEALAGDVQARIGIFQGDMRSFTFDEKFAVVMIPFRAFLHNLTWDDQLACLRRAHVHLLPGGQLAFNVFHPSLEYMAQYAGAQAGVSRWRGTRDLTDGRYVVQSEATRYDTVRQQLHSMLKSEEYGPEGNLLSTSNLRLHLAYLYPGDIARLLEHAGFELTRISGDFTGRPFERDGDELVVEARRSP